MVVLASPTTEIVLHDETFSPEWLEGYYGGELGCDLGRGSYTWRPYGFGSNMNSECFVEIVGDAVRIQYSRYSPS